MKKGTITVFLSLILSVILSLVFSIIESARVSAIRARIEMVMDMGLYSIFAEYNRELLSSYDLYYIDSSYGRGKASVTNIGAHLKDYLQYNFNTTKGSPALFTTDFTGLSAGEVKISGESLATDSAGRVFKRQAIHAVKDHFGISIIDRAKSTYHQYKGGAVDEKKVEEKRERILKKLEDLDLNSAGKAATKVLDKRPGILNLILNNLGNVSDKAPDLSSLASYRKLSKGIGMVRPDEDPDSLTNELLFNEYIAWKFSSYRKNPGNAPLSYEQEYILNGKNSDMANLRATAEKLFLLREAADTAAVFNDSIKRGEAEALSETICALLCVPEAAEAVTDFLLLAWGFGESVVDVRTLLNGGKVPLVKSGSDFSIRTLTELPLFMSINPGKEQTEGLSYEEYLRLFLMLENKTKKVMRTMDVIELNLRTTKGNSSFKLDSCVEYLEAELTAKSRYGYEYSILRDFAYEPVIE
ncbi:MAG: DUF5702 domain-containing protein [Lachnospiraceae bacterium]|nr:DUF5702 domain-containing protein [Lachnospiraceae bacterium]